MTEPVQTARKTEDNLIVFTVAAQNQVRKTLAEDPAKRGLGVRLGVKGGGCSGFSYVFDFDAKRENDHVIPYDGFDVLLDLKSAIYLKGTTVDFQGGLMGHGFVFRNPNATNSCGCGESFSV